MSEVTDVHDKVRDGVHAPVPREAMSAAARKLRDVYARAPGAPLYHCEDLGYFSLDAWKAQGMPEDVPRHALFDLDTGGYHLVMAKALDPLFEVKLLEDRGAYELVRDAAGLRPVSGATGWGAGSLTSARWGRPVRRPTRS